MDRCGLVWRHGVTGVELYGRHAMAGRRVGGGGGE